MRPDILRLILGAVPWYAGITPQASRFLAWLNTQDIYVSASWLRERRAMSDSEAGDQ